jgi:hypothetical protein
LKDVLIDLIAMPAARWRVTMSRRLPRATPKWFTYYALPLVLAGGIIAAGAMLVAGALA